MSGSLGSPFQLLVPSKDGYVHFLTVVFLNGLVQCHRTLHQAFCMLMDGTGYCLRTNVCVLRVEVYQGEKWKEGGSMARKVFIGLFAHSSFLA